MPTNLFDKMMKKHMEDILYLEKELRNLEIFTQKRLELIHEIMESHPRSIRGLAEKLDRDIKNVFEDLKLLHEAHLVDFVKEGRCKRPVVKKKVIIIKLG